MIRYKIQIDVGLEPDCIIDTKTNKLYGHDSADTYALCNLLNSKDTKWQKLKEWIEEREKKHTLILKASAFEDIEILNKMQELEGEDDL